MNMNTNKVFENSRKLLALLSEADIATLALVLSQLTNKLKYIENIRPYIKGAFDYSVRVPDDIANNIRKELAQVLTKKNNKNIRLNNINDSFIQELMSVGVGEEVPEEYVPMMKEELSIDGSYVRDENVEKIKINKNTNEINVVIIGAGLCGILAGIKLLQANISFTIIEKNNSIGGTWYENSYPGCGVDTPNHVYAYSFEPSFKWNEFYSKRDSIYEYLQFLIENIGLVGIDYFLLIPIGFYLLLQ